MRIILSQLTKPVESFVKVAKELDNKTNHTDLTHFVYDNNNEPVAHISARHRIFDVYSVSITNHKARVMIEIQDTLQNITPKKIKDIAIEFKKRVKAS